ncbi:succinate dehydrogenase iron-sulfur subunit [Candidatus Marsarchaeota archaeon]|nr:succinate dehydrogenase iron-sulfur subunit [Candidatus Marsarchaeota archaeon]
MKTSLALAPMYAAMMGVPVLMVLYLLALLFVPAAAHYVFVPLIIIGLLAFGISGMVEVYVKGHAKSPALSMFNHPKKEKGMNISELPGNPAELIVTRLNAGAKEADRQIYALHISRFTSVLDMLCAVKEKGDQTLSFRYSCRMGICGSCAMVINGKPALACETNAMKNLRNGAINVQPMQAHPILKDLVCDLDEFFAKHLSVTPRLYRRDKKGQYEAQEEYPQKQSQIQEFLPYSYCIMCGLCMDACPVVNVNPDFIGPQPLSQAYRYYKDSRDQLNVKRLNEIDTLEGLWGCEYAGACSKVCPKGVDPASAIQLMKKDTMKSNITNEKKG